MAMPSGYLRRKAGREQEKAMSKKKKQKHLIHPLLGNLKYCEGWAWLPQSPLVKLKVPVWGKVYGAAPVFMAKSADQGITPQQEEAYRKFESLVMEQTGVMEQMISEHCKSAAAERIVPSAVYFGRGGECLLEFRNDGVFVGFSIFLAPKVFLCDTWAANCYMKEDPKAADSVCQIREKLFGEGGTEAEVLNTEAEDKEEKVKQFWVKYAQVLLDYEREEAEKNRQLLEQYDSIKMPGKPLKKTLLGAGIIVICTIALGWIGHSVVFLDYDVMDPIRQLLVLLVSAFFWFIFSAGCFFNVRDQWSDYLSARKDFDTYRWEKIEQESNPDR